MIHRRQKIQKVAQLSLDFRRSPWCTELLQTQINIDARYDRPVMQKRKLRPTALHTGAVPKACTSRGAPGCAKGQRSVGFRLLLLFVAAHLAHAPHHVAHHSAPLAAAAGSTHVASSEPVIRPTQEAALCRPGYAAGMDLRILGGVSA